MNDVSPRFRPVLDTVPAYKPGQAPTAVAGEAHKLSSNESPYGPLPSVVEVIAEAARAVNRYPDNGAAALTDAIARRFGVPVGHVAVGCGSVGVLQQLMEAVGEPGAEVLYAWRSFEAYPPLADLAAAPQSWWDLVRFDPDGPVRIPVPGVPGTWLLVLPPGASTACECQQATALAGEAVEAVKAKGYTPIETSQYHPTQTLRVLVATNNSSASSYGQQAFFFVNGRYIGTDTKEPSATVKVIAQSDTEITLGYQLYRPNDALSSPSGGQAVVRFQLDNGKLASLNQIPPAHSNTGLSRN